MEPITTSKTTTKINTQQIYPQHNSNRKTQAVAESSSNGGRSEGTNRDIEGLEENETLTESGDTSSTGDPFLLVSLRDSKNSPRRPKNASYLYMLALLDLGIITICTILLVHKDKEGHWHWKRAAWDWVALGLVRFIIVIGVASSKWIRELHLILGSVVCFSSLYIIFKFNLIFQQKKPIDKYHIILLVSSFFFCLIHWIAYIVITTDDRRKERFLKNRSICFEEESIPKDVPSHRSYGAIANQDDEIGILSNDNNN
ncbi:hypothetical protein RclHR1_00220013 [Rhizophagus clarus]|uniref:Uncharacterized protein n=1 Tax=Rhizophagus clarus TaxID=94130 RepID=A0A2Z6R6Y3_9GLOM|nr:hypothetical protein RclHR1_00220013 [Rhizophagus clarus]GES75551.1 hypothetical protein GLOIN_2v1623923 [Rhizophagus clarus]